MRRARAHTHTREHANACLLGTSHLSAMRMLHTIPVRARVRVCDPAQHIAPIMSYSGTRIPSASSIFCAFGRISFDLCDVRASCTSARLILFRASIRSLSLSLGEHYHRTRMSIANAPIRPKNPATKIVHTGSNLAALLRRSKLHVHRSCGSVSA